MTPTTPRTRGRKRQLTLEVTGLDGPLGDLPPWERSLVEPALAEMLTAKPTPPEEEARDAAAP